MGKTPANEEIFPANSGEKNAVKYFNCHNTPAAKESQVCFIQLIFAEINIMDLNVVSIILSGLAIALAVYSILKKAPAPSPVEDNVSKFDSVPLQLQAYERLVLLTERIALPNLISRLNQPGLSSFEMKIILTENIKQEFEHNSTQQLYVSPVSWDAVRNLKEQNILVINQVSSILPSSASGGDLNKKILEVIMSQPGGALHEMVAQALNFEAKKLMRV